MESYKWRLLSYDLIHIDDFLISLSLGVYGYFKFSWSCLDNIFKFFKLIQLLIINEKKNVG